MEGKIGRIPVCIETKQDHALYELLSHSPETRQHAMIGISAQSSAISAPKCWTVDFHLLTRGLLEPLDLVSVVGRISDRDSGLGEDGGDLVIVAVDGGQ